MSILSSVFCFLTAYSFSGFGSGSGSVFFFSARTAEAAVAVDQTMQVNCCKIIVRTADSEVPPSRTGTSRFEPWQADG